MARSKKPTGSKPVETYRHDEKRANIPTNELRGFVEGDEARPSSMLYPRDPSLDPQLVWKGKDEQDARDLEVPVVPIYIQEKILPQVIIENLRDTARKGEPEPELTLFNDYDGLEFPELVDFYHHGQNWANRMILGDSLLVMTSLAEKEGLKGKVQMIYMDPPYGIKFSSNFQPEIGKRDVKDKETDLTREPEMVKAYQDTWTLGVHSYLAYLRDRLWLCKELLADTGGLFVQIGDENFHRVRAVCDEVFTPANFVSDIILKKGGTSSSELLSNIADHILCYAKDKGQLKFHTIYDEKAVGKGKSTGARYDQAEHLFTGERRPLSAIEKGNPEEIPSQLKPFKLSNPCSMHDNPKHRESPLLVNDQEFFPPSDRQWSSNPKSMTRVVNANRLVPTGKNIAYVMYVDDFPAVPINNIWTELLMRTGKEYIVQTAPSVIERCLLMTTDPGDLVLDPTCGSGTTAYVAEQWGRRWITIDTSRVALALARQRLLTASFPLYKVNDGDAGGDLAQNPGKGFLYKSVPHITLKSIAQNVVLDPIFARHESILEERLKRLNAALKKVAPSLRQKFLAKLTAKERAEGKKAITDADRRRWQLPKEAWKEWEVPFDTDEDWPAELKTALTEYRSAWRAKMDEVNACIAAHAEPEELVDQPEIVRGVARVSGPFTMEGVMPIEQSLMEPSPIGGEPEEMETFGEQIPPSIHEEPANAEAYMDKMLRLLKADGVRFPNNKTLQFSRLEPYSGEYLHGEGEWETENGEMRKVAVSFGPEFGPVTAYQVENAIPMAARRGFDDLVFAGFSFDAAAQAIIQEDPNPRIRCHLAHIRPDVNMGSLLKETPNSQLFTVFGSPRTYLREIEDGMFVVEMEGVDIYNPVDNTILPTSADKVAAWFLDTDWDGRTFCITQAFFPDRSAWAKIGRSLKGVIDEERFAALAGTVSLPFPPGKKGWVAVKVIDPRGNEVMSLHRLPGKGGVAYEQE